MKNLKQMPKCLTQVMLVSALSLLTRDASAVNAVRIESGLLRAVDTAIIVGVFIDNDVTLNGLVLPLEFRGVFGAEYFSGNLSVRISESGRFREWIPDSATTGVRSWYAAKSSDTDRFSICCALDSSESVWRSTTTGGDHSSPDAFLFAAASNSELLDVAPGSDSLYPSFEIQLGPGSGVVEVDTTCIWPNNRLTFVEAPYYPVSNVEFVKGIIEVCAPETLSSHITVADSLKFDVHLAGDLVVDSGVTLTVLPTARITAVDSASLRVFGTLIFDTSRAGSAAFSCDEVGGDSWDGIWIPSGGNVQWGNGCVINGAATAIKIDPGATSSEIRNVTVNDPVTAGFDISQAIELMNDTINASGADYGVVVNGCDPTIDSTTISGCATGIYSVGSSSQLSAISINGPGAYGVYAATGAENPGEDTLTLDQVDIVGHFSGAHFHAEPSAHALIDGCNLLTETVDSLQSHFGIKAYDGAFVRVRNSLILNCDTAFYSYNSNADLGTSGSSGNNSIYRDSCAGSCPGSKVFAECELDLMGGQGEGSEMDGPGGPPPPDPVCLIKAEGNWWGSSSPSSSWFTNIDYNPWLNDDPLGKIASWRDTEVHPATSPSISISNYPNPFNPSTTIMFNLPKEQHVRVVVFNILGQEVKEIADGQFAAGDHRVEWDGRDKDNQNVASGVYLYRITTSEESMTRKMTLLR